MDVTDTHLAALSPEAWTGLVRRLLEDDRAEVLRLRHEPIFIGAGTGTHLFRATGSATTGAGQSTDWSLVIKVFTTEHLDFETLSDDPSAWNYWKREWEAYQTPWFTELTGPLVPPRCAVPVRSVAARVRWPGSPWRTWETSRTGGRSRSSVRSPVRSVSSVGAI